MYTVCHINKKFSLMLINSGIGCVYMFDLISMKLDSNQVIENLKKYWYTVPGLIIILIVVCIGVLKIINFFYDITIIKGVIIVISCCVVVISIWYYRRQLPTAKKDTIGVAISILTENTDEYRTVSSDLIYELKEFLTTKKYKYTFSFVIFPEYYAKKIDNPSTAIEYMHKAKCRFIIFGRVRTRTVDKKETYLLETKAAVSHRPLPQAFCNQMGNEFGKIYPLKLNIDKEEEALTFEITSEWMGISTEYMIGCGALVSGDLDYAESLLENLQKEIQTYDYRQKIPVLDTIKLGLKHKLNILYHAQTSRLMYLWRRKRDVKLLISIKPYFEKWEKISPNNYNLKLVKAICCFVVDHDITRAKKILKTCSKVKTDSAWLYSLAFLEAYDGHMYTAKSYYSKAFRRKIITNTIFQVEDFICWILEKEENKTQLYFCLGLINFRGKVDLLIAKKDFENFVKLTPANKFNNEIILAKKHIQEINDQLSSQDTKQVAT